MRWAACMTLTSSRDGPANMSGGRVQMQKQCRTATYQVVTRAPPGPAEHVLIDAHNRSAVSPCRRSSTSSSSLQSRSWRLMRSAAPQLSASVMRSMRCVARARVLVRQQHLTCCVSIKSGMTMQYAINEAMLCTAARAAALEEDDRQTPSCWHAGRVDGNLWLHERQGSAPALGQLGLPRGPGKLCGYLLTWWLNLSAAQHEEYDHHEQTRDCRRSKASTCVAGWARTASACLRCWTPSPSWSTATGCASPTPSAHPCPFPYVGSCVRMLLLLGRSCSCTGATTVLM